ncbi:MAG: hypothetical protein VX733_09355 [Candidatus Latescibacterota bacterium]|nr:hypothetical protein [Candidatus Latescibacterota bacterium]
MALVLSIRQLTVNPVASAAKRCAVGYMCLWGHLLRRHVGREPV